MKKSAIYVILLMSLATTAKAQNQTDTLTTQLRRYVARNFSEARTFNLYWEVNPTLDYTLKQNGRLLERGEMQEINTVKFSTTLPVLLLKKFSLYANGQANFYQFKAINNANGATSSIFSSAAVDDDGYNYYKGAISGTYRTKIAGKPLMLNANISGDGWSKGFEEVQGTFSALLVFNQTGTTNFSAGLYGMTHFIKVPVLPIIIYWHQFNPKLCIDITLPSRAYLRYQFLNNHRLSIGTSMESEQFYMKPGLDNLPDVCLYNKATIKPEIVYEYIINKHFYLIARGGGVGVINGGFYKTNRKGINGDPYVKVNHPMTLFFNIGISYNLFKDRD